MRSQKILFKQAICLLKEHGFQDNEIKTEYNIHTDELGKLRIDVVGIKNSRRVAIECGHLQPPRIKRVRVIKKYFDDFIHLTYNGFRVFKGNIKIKRKKYKVLHIKLDVWKKFHRLKEKLKITNSQLLRTLIAKQPKMDIIAKRSKR